MNLRNIFGSTMATATAMIEAQLEEEAYTVGAFSTNTDKTISIKMA